MWLSILLRHRRPAACALGSSMVSGNWRLAMESSSKQGHSASRDRREDLRLAAVARVWWFHRSSIIVTTLMFALLTAVILASQQPEYTAETLVKLDELPPRLVRVGYRTTFDPRQDPIIGTSLAFMSSRAFLRKVAVRARLFSDAEFGAIERFETNDTAQVNAAYENTIIDTLADRLTVAQRGGSHVISIAIASRSPEKAKFIVNTAAQTFIDDQLQRQREDEAKAMAWLTNRIEKLQGEIVGLEGRILEITTQQGFYGLDLDQFANRPMETRLAELTTKLVAAKAEGAELRALFHEIDTQTSVDSATRSLYLAKSPVLQDLMSREVQLQRRLSELGEELGPQHPTMINLTNEINNTQQLKESEFANIKNGLKSALVVNVASQDEIEYQILALKSGINDQDKTTVELIGLRHEIDTDRNLLSRLVSQYQGLEQNQALKRAQARVMSPASTPRDPDFPKLFPTVPLLALAGFFLALAAVFLRERWVSDFGFKSMEDLRRYQLDPLGYIPELSGSQAQGRSVADYAFTNPCSAQSEAIQRIRNRLCTMSSAQSEMGMGCVILVTSSEPLEGKTSAAVVMSRQSAMSGANTLLIDADIRNPGVHSALGLPPKAGLCELFQGMGSKDVALCKDPLTPLSVMQAGVWHTDSALHICSGQMNLLLQELRRHYDWIFIDSPSISAVADAVTLASYADTTLYLMRWLTTTRSAANVAIDQLCHIGANVAGVALSRVDLEAGRKYQHLDDVGYYGYYHNRAHANA